MKTVTKSEAIRELDLAVRHPRARNKHIKRVLRWAVEPTNATTLAELLSHHNGTLVQAIDAEGHLDDYSVLGVLFRTDAARMLEEVDVLKLDSALHRAICGYADLLPAAGLRGKGSDVQDGVSEVRAAYVLARDLAVVEFDELDDEFDDQFDDEVNVQQ